MTELRFFVYGSMSQGYVHFERIRNFVSSIRPASIHAKAFKLKVGYPVLVNEPSDLIFGELVELKTLTTHQLLFALLDEFHGYRQDEPRKCLHVRSEVSAQLDTGEVVSAQCYFLVKDKLPRTAQPIAGGKWQEVCQEKAALTHRLSERQKSYISRLGATVGRDVIPIDLTLYRELMNLELIVDKGRRLALSPLGQEVYRYL